MDGERRFLDFGEARDLIRRDQQRIEEAARGRAVGAGAFRLGQEQGMQRADADEVGAERRGIFGEPRQVLEIADAPIAGRAQRIGLHGEAPGALFHEERRPERGVGQSGDVLHTRRFRHILFAVQRHAHRLENLGLGLVGGRDPVALLADIALGDTEALRQFLDRVSHAGS
ncbi:hypothetical protein AUC68_00110 [Methyloceanibacter methanicus]|uniref:Uncharacterized protein n=1 Tax=Methyloceanibacter methanicus TaxID=1774968 RepID=A0A1E3W656_9HYPH|nr:hypothetical protein AUC68_00110 [Methyloceanibacter methanicus]